VDDVFARVGDAQARRGFPNVLNRKLLSVIAVSGTSLAEYSRGVQPVKLSRRRDNMFNGNGLFSKKEDLLRKDPKTNASGPAAAPIGQLPSAPAQSAHPAPAPARAPEGKGSKLIVGPDIKLKGVEITDCDTLVVEGRVEASMDSRVIQIAEQGMFQGTAGIDVAEIHGRFEGELTVRKQLVIHATGKVTGKIRYGKLTIEEGGELSGEVGTLAASDSLARKEQRATHPGAKLPIAGMV
jgi:cytoskeletal protein CcmA (bactofilin family)